ncbi:MAG: FHA domain-containing protein [Candidatus Omnitrophota bacterium]
MIGGKAGDWASNLFVGFVKDGRITTEEAVRQAKEQEIIKIRRELYRLINDHKMFDLIGGSYYRINTNVFRENGMAEGIINANLKRELNINNDNELVVMYGLARQIAEFIETFQYLKKINLIEERLDVVNSGLIYGVDLNWDYRAEYINAGGDIGRGRYIPVDSFKKDKAKAVLNALGRLSQIGYEIDILDGERQIVPKGNRMKRQQSPAKPAKSVQQPTPKKEQSARKVDMTMTVQQAEKYNLVKERFAKLKNIFKLVMSSEEITTDVLAEVANDMRPLLIENLNRKKGKALTESAPGLREFSAKIPFVAIGDIHARGQKIDDILSTEIEIDGEKISFLKLISLGLVQIDSLGDIMHSENNKDMMSAGLERGEIEVKRKGEFKPDLSDLYEGLTVPPKVSGQENWAEHMYREATRSLATAYMILLLENVFPDYFEVVKGNHDNILNSREKGNLPYARGYFAVGDTYHKFFKAKLGEGYLNLYAEWENLLKIAFMVAGRKDVQGKDLGNIFGSHSDFWSEKRAEEKITEQDFKDIKSGDEKAKLSLTAFDINGDVRNKISRSKELLEVLNCDVHVVGHRPAETESGGVYLKGNNVLRLNNPDPEKGPPILLVLPDEQLTEETLMSNIFNPNNIGEAIRKVYNYWAKQPVAQETPEPSKVTPDNTVTSFRSQSTTQAADDREYPSLPKEGVVLDAGEEHAFIYEEDIPARVIFGETAKQGGYDAFIIEQAGRKGLFNFLANISAEGVTFKGTFGADIVNFVTVGSRDTIKIDKIPEPVAPTELKAGASEQEKTRHKLAQERHELDKERFDALQEKHAAIYFDGGRNIRVLDTSAGKKTRIESARFPARDIKINRSQFSYYHDAANGPVEILAAPGNAPYKLTINFNEQTDEFEISGEGIETKKIKVIRDDNGKIDINKIQVYTFGKRKAGENDTTHIQLATNSGYVSSRHGEIQFNGLFVTIRDYSTNGTLARSVKSPAPSPAKAEPKKASPVANYTVKYVYNLFKLYVVESQDIKALQKAIDYLAANQPEVLKATIKEILKEKDINLNDNDYLKIKNQAIAEAKRLLLIRDKISPKAENKPINGMKDYQRLQELKYNQVLIEQAI